MRLRKDARPIDPGLYMAGNYNQIFERLEIDWVRLAECGNVTVVEEGKDGYQTSDWDFWSTKMMEESV